MLQRLTVENFVLIRKLSIDFSKGFTAITGETGAGKSILLGALGLVLGQRADSQSLLDKEKKCVIEAEFNIVNYDLQAFFSTHDLEYDDLTILRREISSNGKSRAFINDTPASLQQLKDLGGLLVDIHSQHAIITLSDTSMQRDLLDGFSLLQGALSAYREEYFEMLRLESVLQKLRAADVKAKQEADYLNFLLDELNKASLQPDEQKQLEQGLSIQTHAEELKSAIQTALFIANEEDHSVIRKVHEIIVSIRKPGEFHPALKKLQERLEEIYVDLKDIASELERSGNRIEINPQRIEEMQSRLHLIYQLQHKHKVSSMEALLEIKRQLEIKLNSYLSLEEEIASTEQNLSNQKERVLGLSDKLSDSRLKSAPEFGHSIRQLIHQLGMLEATFQVEVVTGNEPGPYGQDLVQFLFSSRRAGEMRALAQVASGGELSRIMLAVKYLLAHKKKLPTVIFDEIDSGISGEIAGRMGAMMRQMAEAMQVITITHLPQIAGRANHHLLAYKSTSDGQTHSDIRPLTKEEKTYEIARMLSDEQITEAGLRAAQELMKD